MLVLAAQGAIIAIRWRPSPDREVQPAPSDRAPEAIFSVHVATHAEPPAMVSDTLIALARQDYPADRFEVIVIDNNTADPSLWKPVRKLCRDLGEGFRFEHRMNVAGAKAGALNIALGLARPDATHVVTVDADYVTDPNFLTVAARALRSTGADYVQFPQAYRRPPDAARGVDGELEEYFRTSAQMADGVEALLPTGTLSVISKAALAEVGGWSARTTTEDAELGVRLCRAGYVGRYVARSVGRGLLPFRLKDLETQRHRWASGNLRTLMLHLPSMIRGQGADELRRTLAIVAQLGAWLNFSLIPAAILLGCMSLGRPDDAPSRIAAFSILLGLADFSIRLAYRGILDRASPAIVLETIAARIALAPAAACATLDALLPSRLTFVVTAKGADTAARSAPPISHAVLFLLAAAAGATSTPADPLVLLAWFSLLLPLPCALITDAELARCQPRADHLEVTP